MEDKKNQNKSNIIIDDSDKKGKTLIQDNDDET